MPSNVNINCFVDPSFGENGYVVHVNGECWIVDPGLPPAASQIIDFIQKNRLAPAAIVLTHGHADHIAGVPEIIEAFPELPIYIADEAKPALTDPNENLSSGLGFPIQFEVTKVLGLPAPSQLQLAGTNWHILDTSGHAPGSRSLYCPTAGMVIVGDALFHSSIGRTDFPHSHHDTLISNIKNKLFALPDETKVYSGHGPVTTIGRERKHNPFLK